MNTTFYSIHTGAAAEILAEDEATVTFRTLPTGRPNTIPREKFEKSFLREKEQPKPELPKSKEVKILVNPPDKPRKPKVYRDRRAYYRENRDRLKAKSLAYYYLRKFRERLLPLSEGEKSRIAEEHERKKAYQRDWWHKRKDRTPSTGQKVDKSSQEPPYLGPPAGDS
jgi:hypothetical protein